MSKIHVTSGQVRSGSVYGQAAGGEFTIASGSISRWDIGSGAIRSGHISSGQLGQFHFASGVLIVSGTGGGVSSGSITQIELANNSVRSGHIASGSISRFHLASGAVNSGHIVSGAVVGQAGGGAFNIASGTIAGNDIASDSIHSGHISSGQIGPTHLSSGAVNSGHIASGQVGSFHIASGAVGSGRLATIGTPDGSKVLRDDFVWVSPGSAALTSGVILSGHVGDNAVVSGSIASGQISRFHLASGAVNSGHVASGAVLGQAGGGAFTIASGTIGTFDVGSGQITAGNLASGSVVSGRIASGQIGRMHLGSGVALLGVDQTFTGICTFNPTSGQIKLGSWLELASPPFTGDFVATSPFTFHADFVSLQSGQYARIAAITRENKFAGIYHFDVGHANGRLATFETDAGVYFAIRPAGTELLRMNGFGGITDITTSGNWVFYSPNNSSIPIIIGGQSGQVTPLLRVQDSDGNMQASIDASGIIFGKSLSSGLVRSGAIASGVVGLFHIASGAVASGRLAVTGTPDGTKFLRDDFSWATATSTSGSVTSGYIGDNAVNSGNIASGSISRFHLASGAVNSGHVASGAVLGQAGGGAFTIASGTIGTFDIGSGAIQSGRIASGQIGSFHIASGGVRSGNIASGQIGQYHLASGAVNSGQINDSSVNTINITDDAITTVKIASGQVQNKHIASGVLQVAAGSQGFVQFNRSGYLMGVGEFIWDNDTTTLTASRFQGDASLLTGFGSGVITAFSLGSGAVTSGKIASGQIGSFHIGSGAIVSGHVASGQIGSFHIASGAVGSGRLATTGTPDGSKVLRDDFTWVSPGSATLASGVIISGHIGNNAVVSGSVASGQLSTYHLASGAVCGITQFVAPFVPNTNWTANVAEMISGVRAVSVTKSGLVQIAMASDPNRMPAIGIAITNVTSGTTEIQAFDVFPVGGPGTPLTVYSFGAFQMGSGLVDYSGYLGNQLYVGRSGQIVTASGSWNSGGLISGDILQPIGTVLNSGAALISTYAPYVSGTALNSGAVQSGSIASGSVSRFHLASGAVNSGHVASGAVQGQAGGGAFNIASGTIGTFDIGSGAIVSGRIASGVVGLFHVASGAVGSGRLSVTGTPDGTKVLRDDFTWVSPGAATLTSGVIVSGLVGDNAINSGNIASGQIGRFHLASGAVNSGHVASGAVLGQAGGGAFTIASGTIGTFDIGSGTIVSGLIASGQIGLNHLASGSVRSGVVASGQIGSFHIGSGAIISGRVASGQVGSFHISSGAIVSGRIASGVIGSFHISSGGVLSGNIASGQIGRFHLASGAVNSGHIGDAAVVSGSVASGQITYEHIAAESIVGSFGIVPIRSIRSGTIGFRDIGAGQILSGHIGANIIGTPHFISGATITAANTVQPFVSGSFSTILTEEPISGGRTVAISQSGCIRIAMASMSGRMPAIGVVVDNVASGIQANVFTVGNIQATSGMSDYSGYLGQPLFVGRSGKIVTASGSFNSGGFVSGDILQQIGIVINSGGAIIGVNAPYVSGSILSSGIVISGSIASGQVGRYHLGSGVALLGTTNTFSSVQTIRADGDGGLTISVDDFTDTRVFEYVVNGTPITYIDGTDGYITAPSFVGDGSQLTNLTITSGKILSGHIASGQVGSFHISSGAIVSGRIASGVIGSFHISSGAVGSGRLSVTGTPDGTKFLRDDFSWTAASPSLTSGIVTSGHIASGQIGRYHFGSGTALLGVDQTFTGINRFNPTSGELGLGTYLTLASPPFTGDFLAISPFAFQASFISLQSGQYARLVAQTYEGKTAGLTHYDVSHAQGRMCAFTSDAGVYMAFQPSATELLRMNGFSAADLTTSGAWTFYGKNNSTPAITAQAMSGGSHNVIQVNYRNGAISFAINNSGNICTDMIQSGTSSTQTGVLAIHSASGLLMGYIPIHSAVVF